ncbi:hypothetical protein MHYP_G00142450 [Metynnis hypsauchen]
MPHILLLQTELLFIQLFSECESGLCAPLWTEFGLAHSPGRDIRQAGVITRDAAEDAIFHSSTCDQLQYSSTEHHHRHHQICTTDPRPEFRSHNCYYCHRHHNHPHHPPHHTEDVQQEDACSEDAWRELQQTTEKHIVDAHEHGNGERPSELRPGKFRPVYSFFRERIPHTTGGPDKCGPEPHRAVQHHQWLHRGHNT